MLRRGTRAAASALAIVSIGTATPAHADLAQLGDALADVVTFGAWGQSRDLHEAELAQLKAHYELQLQREKNLAAAQVYTAKIQANARNAANSQYVGQQLLKALATISLLEAQLKQIVVERYKVHSNVTRFSTWFDGFTTGSDAEMRAIMKLVKQLNTKDDKTIDALLDATKLEKAQTDEDAAEAASYLKTALQAANSDSASRSLELLEQVRIILTNVIENQRVNIRQLVNEMAADDKARRTLCDPPELIAVACDGNGACRYYSADPAHPMPCEGMTYYDQYPVSAIDAIVAHPESYTTNAEFYVDLGKLATPGKITLTKFRSPAEIFGEELQPKSLLPEPFLFPDRCTNVDRYARRLREAFDYLAIFENSDETSAATKSNIAHLKEQRPVIEFWLDNLRDSVPDATHCSAMSSVARQRVTMLILAVAAAESFNTELTAGDDTSDDAKLLAPIDTLAKDF